MTRLRLPLSVILSIAIATSTFLLGALIVVQACPLTDGGTDGVMNLNQPLRQPGASNPSDVIRPSDDSNRQPLDYVGVVGLGVVIGLFAIALRSKVRRSRNAAPAEADFLRRYPQLEHPELTLTLVPQEALPSTLDTEFSLR